MCAVRLWSRYRQRAAFSTQQYDADYNAKNPAQVDTKQIALSIIDTAPFLISIKSPDGTFLYCNQSFNDLDGAKPEDLIGTNIFDIYDHTVANTILANEHKACEANASINSEERKLHTDGTWHRYATVIFPVRDQHDNLIGTCTISENITDLHRHKMQSQQDDQLRVVGQLAGGIAHDFNNQLQAIQGFSELLADELKEHSKLGEYARHIVTSAARSANLTKQLLAYSRKGDLKNGRVNMHALLEEVCAMLEHTLDKRIRIQCSLLAENPFIEGDQGLLHNALLNLALNARDAMPNGGTLRWTTAQVQLPISGRPSLATGEGIQIALTDTGEGISDDTMQHIFEPFLRPNPLA